MKKSALPFPATAVAFHDALNTLKERFYRMEPELEVTVRDTAMGIEGYVVVWNTAISRGGPLDGCGKGGTRITPTLTLDDVRRLARAMAEKNAAAGLPLGGAKSGLRFDPTRADYEQAYRRFVELCRPFLHENGGCFGGFGYDVGCLPPLNAIWACDQLKSTRCFTGKPVDMGGTDYDKIGIAGLGVATAARSLIEQQGDTVNGKQFSVQGTGAMGAAVIRYFSEYGGILTHVGDPKYGGHWHIKSGASSALCAALADQDTETAQALLAQEGQLLSERASDPLYAEVDVVFPCALEDSLTAETARHVKATYLIEGANNPTTEEAHAILHEKGVNVVPDIIANPGGIIAAFVELTSDVTAAENARTRAKVEEAKALTNTRIAANVSALLSLTKGLGVRADQAGDYLAYHNVFHGLT